jgi:hypothetical protein
MQQHAPPAGRVCRAKQRDLFRPASWANRLVGWVGWMIHSMCPAAFAACRCTSAGCILNNAARETVHRREWHETLAAFSNLGSREREKKQRQNSQCLINGKSFSLCIPPAAAVWLGCMHALFAARCVEFSLVLRWCTYWLPFSARQTASTDCSGGKRALPW